jgi:hypothetical protein
MSGFPIQTAKAAMRRCVEGLAEKDTLNLMTFDGGVGFCFPKPVANTPENRRKALEYLDTLEGGGGTEMMNAIYACLAGQDDRERLRVVCFMTDGCVGNDMAIIEAVRKNAGTARVFSFGIGTSVNRFLLDNIARAGRGDVQYILSEEQAAGAGERFFERVRMPILTDIQLDFGDLAVEEVYPKAIPDLFSVKPVVVKGRYTQGGSGQITLRGRTAQGPFERKISVTLPDQKPEDDVLASLWARAKVEHLMDQDLEGIQRGEPHKAIKEEIVGLGLGYRLMTQFTSFVAVETTRVTEGGPAKTVAVPAELPDKVNYQGIFGRPGVASSGGVVLADLSIDSLGSTPGAGGSGDGFGMRAGTGKSVLASGGGTVRSERTVAGALSWIAQHQNADGSGWNFAPQAEQKPGFPQPGTCRSKTGATSLALLPYLAAGQTHKSKGPYQKVIDLTLKSLLAQAAKRPEGLDFRGDENDLVWHATSTLVLCEAYGMTKDAALEEPAQKAVDFLVAMQDKTTGGWAGKPGQKPSVIVTAWQIWALHGAKLAGLKVDPEVQKRAGGFPDRMQTENGTFYGDTAPGKDPTATAAAALSRILLGGDVKKPPLSATLDYLAQQGPSKDDLVYDLFATTALHADPGPRWDTWNRQMRRVAIEAQTKDGDQSGSWWAPTEAHAAEGGRLFQTAVNTLILEVYYRYLPVWQ